MKKLFLVLLAVATIGLTSCQQEELTTEQTTVENVTQNLELNKSITKEQAIAGDIEFSNILEGTQWEEYPGCSGVQRADIWYVCCGVITVYRRDNGNGGFEYNYNQTYVNNNWCN